MKKLRGSAICKHLDCSEPSRQMLIKTVCDGIGARLLKERGTTVEPFHKRGSTPPLEFLAAGWGFGQTSLARRASESFSQGGT